MKQDISITRSERDAPRSMRPSLPAMEMVRFFSSGTRFSVVMRLAIPMLFDVTPSKENPICLPPFLRIAVCPPPLLELPVKLL